MLTYLYVLEHFLEKTSMNIKKGQDLKSMKNATVKIHIFSTDQIDKVGGLLEHSKICMLAFLHFFSAQCR